MNLLWLHHPIAQALGLALLHFLWQAGLLAAGIALLLWLFKGSSPRLRYGLACSGMLALSTLPAITFHQLWNRPASFVETGIAIAPRPMAPSETSTTASVPPAMAWRQRALQLVDRSLPSFLIAWAIGVLVLSSRLTGGWAWLQWLRRRPETVAAGDDHQLVLLRLCQRMGLVSNIRLLHCDRVEGPTVLGWLKPVVLIPGAALTGLSPQQLEMVLAHELAHILRHDYAVNLIQSILEVLFFYHPAVWWLSARIRQERELCCDDLAVRYAGDALDYARALTRLEALRLESGSPPLALALCATGGSFMHRIQRLISPTTPTPLAPRAGILALLFLFVAAGLTSQSHAQETTQVSGPNSGYGYVWTPSPDGKSGTLVTTANLDEKLFAQGRAAHLNRFNQDSVDGSIKAGMVSLEGSAKPSQVISALDLLRTLPAGGPVTTIPLLYPEGMDSDPQASLYSFNLPPQPQENLRAILSSMPSRRSLDHRPGLVLVRRWNTPTPEMKTSIQGLLVDAVAEDVEIDTILEALAALEAMPPTPGVVQEVQREAGHGQRAKMSLDLKDVDPSMLQSLVQKELLKSPKL